MDVGWDKVGVEQARDELALLKRIVVGTDFSDGSARAVLVAVQLAKLSGATVDLVHVYPMPMAGKIWPLPDVVPLPSPTRDVVNDIQRRLDEVAERVSAATVNCLTFTHQGDVARELIEHADHARADLIVIGRHGKTHGSRSIGTVARRVVRKGHCPVLVVP